MSLDTLRRKFDKAVHSARRRFLLRGRLARKNSDGSYSMVVSDRPGMVYVTLTGDGSQTVDIAHPGATPRLVNLPVTLERIGGHLVVTGLDYEGGVLEAYLAGGIAAAPPHTHRTGSGLEYETEPEWFKPGRVLWSSGVTVRIRPFFYLYGGVNKYFAGDTLSLSSYLPATSSKWAWVLTCLEPELNTPIAVTGDEYAAQVDLTDALIADIEPGYYIPLAAVQCQNGDTSLSSISRYRDARRWIA